jgi:putative peptidoglycan lipid II flippase
MAKLVPSTRTMARGAAISSLAVMGSRILGLVREQIFAYFFGASREYDAFLTAFRIPNLLRDLLAEGALSAAFVTVFVREMTHSGTAKAYRLANSVANTLALVLLVIVAIGIYCAPELVHGMALGFDADKAALTVSLTRLMFPFILFVALAAVCMGMLNAQERYALPQSASTFFNLTSITVGLTCAWCLAPDYIAALWHHGQGTLTAGLAQSDTTGWWASFLPRHLHAPAARAMVGMACGTLAGGLVQWWIQMPLLWRLGWRYQAKIDGTDPALKDVLKLMGPAVLGAGAVQLSVFINSNFASTLGDKPISWLSYSFRLMQFPIGVFGVAVMTATLPMLSRHAAKRDHAAFGDTLTQALELVLCLTVPAALGLIVLGEPIVRLLFEHGRFSHTDTLACAHAVAAYAVGLPGYSALKVVQPAFVAQGDAKTPMRVTFVGVLATVGLNLLFLYGLHLGHVGLALSTSVMATFSTLALLVLLERRRPLLARRRLLQEGWRVAGATGLMGFAIFAVLQVLNAWGLGRTGWQALMEMTLLMPLAAGVYFWAGRALGVKTLSLALGLVQKKVRGRK